MSVSWLLVKKSGRQSLGRLGLVVAAIALGVVILLSLVSLTNGLLGRIERESWTKLGDLRDSAYGKSEAAKQAQTPIDGVAPLQIAVVPGKTGNIYKFRNQYISQVVLNATGKNSPEFEGLKTPKLGEYYFSAALDKIAREHPEENIGARFGTKYLGVIPEKYNSSPDALEVIRGSSSEELALWQAAAAGGESVVANLYTTKPTAPSNTYSLFSPDLLTVLALGGTILLFPIVMFLSVSMQLGSVQREQRYAALRLIGATRGQVNNILLLESFAATIAGIVVGTMIYLILRPLLVLFEFGGAQFWLNDLTVSPLQYAIMAALTVGLSMFASWRAMRKVRTSPLGVVRRENLDKKPRVWRILPLVAGIGMFVWLTTSPGTKWLKDEAAESMLPLLYMVVGILLVMFGLTLAGSWITSALSRLFANRTKNASILLASRRISGHSRKVFRSVAGVVLALFAGSFYLAAVSNISELEIASVQDNGYSQMKKNTALISSDSLADDFAEKLRGQAYIKSYTTVFEDEKNTFIPCENVKTYIKHECPSGATADDFAKISFTEKAVKNIETVKEANLPAEKSIGYFVLHDGSESNIDKLRNLADANTPAVSTVFVADGTQAQMPRLSSTIKELAALTYVGIGITMFVAIASLIVSTIGGLFERRRSMFTLRLGGMTIEQLRSVVLIESLIPLIATSILAAAAGIWVATIFLKAMSTSVQVALSPTYFAIVLGGLLLAIAGIWSVLPILKKLTSLEQNQTE